MDISGAKVEQAWLFTVKGRMDTQTAGQAEATLKQWVADGESRLVGDLSDLNYISSAGLRVMLVAAKAAKAQGGGVCIFGLQDTVRAVFEIAGFNAIIPILGSREEALAWTGE